MKLCGIYLIQIDKYKYIGQSVDIKSRIRGHKCTLRNSNHCNKYMQRVYNKYRQFNYIILWQGERSLLSVMETMFISFFKESEVLNIKHPEDSRILTKEHKQNISQSLKNSQKLKDSIPKALATRKLRYNGPSEAQLANSKRCSEWFQRPEVRLKSVESRKKSLVFKEARKKCGEKLKGNQFALGKTNGIKNGNCDPLVYVFQNKKTLKIFVGTRYDLAIKVGKTSYALSNLILGREKSAFGYKLLACPLLK